MHFNCYITELAVRSLAKNHVVRKRSWHQFGKLAEKGEASSGKIVYYLFRVFKNNFSELFTQLSKIEKTVRIFAENWCQRALDPLLKQEETQSVYLISDPYMFSKRNIAENLAEHFPLDVKTSNANIWILLLLLLRFT